MIRLIAVVDADFGVSKCGKIPWGFSEDRQLFQARTKNCVLAMGKNTFEETEEMPLKGRINCVVSRELSLRSSQDDYGTKYKTNVRIFRALEDVCAKYADFWLIGGAKLYNYALKKDLVGYALITRVHQCHNADTFLDSFQLEKFSRKILEENDRYSISEYFSKVFPSV
ncbi:MAG: dihydrofolate reductase [Holosporaceae bacterium]|nr:dihydrofolate reductase [Holosporaceae bacterium]